MKRFAEIFPNMFAKRVHASPAETVVVAQDNANDCNINLIKILADGDVAIQLERDSAATVHSFIAGDEFVGVIKRVWNTDTTLSNAQMRWYRF